MRPQRQTPKIAAKEASCYNDSRSMEVQAVSTKEDRGRKYFAPEEVAILKANQYVKSVTEKTISLTKECKQRFWEEYKNGKLVSSICADMGLDPKILGERRMYGIRASIVAAVERGEDFRDTRRVRVRKAEENEILSAGPIAYLEHRVAYLEREVEFIKKIICTERGSEQKCSSKKNRTRSSKSSEK